tara:strand:+ start:359 stop:835 length:477 start_codon:yes stop_codon:yes gene_type:complete
MLSEINQKREKKIISKLNLEKLPYNISADNFCNRYLEIFKDLKPLFKYKKEEYAMKWCLSTEKKLQIFLLIFEANELGKEIYKESISSQLSEYSYKTVASIIDEGLDKGYYEKLAPRSDRTTDLKISNIRPSEELVIEFINWNIEVINTISKFLKKYQ